MTGRIAGLMTALAAVDAVHHRGGTAPARAAEADATSSVPPRAAVPADRVAMVTDRPAPAQAAGSSGGMIGAATVVVMTGARLRCHCPS